MPSTHQCMQCETARLWRIIPFRIPDPHATLGAPTLPVATVHALDDPASASDSLSIPRRLSASCFEIRICDSCGYTAWYTRGLESLRALAQRLGEQGRDDIALLDPAASE